MESFNFLPTIRMELFTKTDEQIEEFKNNEGVDIFIKES